MKLHQKGFTLVELVVVITITGILSIVMMQFITRPIQTYADTTRRAKLVDIAQTALQRMVYELRNVLPNSIRVGCSNKCIEYLYTASGGIYRKYSSDILEDKLSFTPADLDDSFDVLGPLNNSSDITTGANISDCQNASASCVAIYNTGFSTANAWNFDNMVTITNVTTTAGLSNIRFNRLGFSHPTAKVFPYESPEQRFYIVNGARSFICDDALDTLKMYQGYSIQTLHSNNDSDAELTGQTNPAESGLLANQVTNCKFDYEPSGTSKEAVLTVELTISENTERISLIEQIYIDNQP